MRVQTSGTWLLYNVHMLGVLGGLLATVLLDPVVMDDVYRVPHLLCILSIVQVLRSRRLHQKDSEEAYYIASTGQVFISCSSYEPIDRTYV